jgi:hypothetical protein
MQGSQEQGYGLLDMRVESRQILVSWAPRKEGGKSPAKSDARNFEARTVLRAFSPEDLLREFFVLKNVNEAWISDPADPSGAETYWKRNPVSNDWEQQ